LFYYNDLNDDDDEPGKSDIICFCATKTERAFGVC
jgi:hypothetical protein